MSPRDTVSHQESQLDNRETIATIPSFSPYDLLSVQHQDAPSIQKGMKLCSKFPILHNHVPIEIVARKGGKSRFHGLQTCNRWLCPVCSTKRTMEHENKVRELFNKTLDIGYSNYFLTLTIPRGNNAVNMLKALSVAWKGMIDSFRKMVKDKIGRESYTGMEIWFVKGLDFTFKENTKIGVFHPHLHVIFGIKRSVVDFIGSENINKKILSFWKKSTRKQGIEIDEQAQKILKADNDTGLSHYITKVCKEQGISWEITSKKKSSKSKKGFGWFDLMARLKADPTDFLRSIYQEFLVAVKGSRMVAYSQNNKRIMETNMEEEDSYLDTDEDIQNSEDNAEEATKTFTLSQAAFKMVSSFDLQAEAIRTTELWSEDKLNSLSLITFESFINHGNIIQHSGSTISQMGTLKKDFMLWIGSMEMDRIIDRERAETIYKKINHKTG